MAWVVLVGPCRACRVERREKLRKGKERRGEPNYLSYEILSYEQVPSSSSSFIPVKTIRVVRVLFLCVLPALLPALNKKEDTGCGWWCWWW